MPFNIRFWVKSSNRCVARAGLAKEALDEFFLIPFHNNARIIDNGTPISPDDIKDIRITETEESFEEIRLIIEAKRTQQEKDLYNSGVLYTNLSSIESDAVDYGTDRTDEFLRTPPQDFLFSVHSSEGSSTSNGDSGSDAIPVTLDMLTRLLDEPESDYLDWKRNWPNGFLDGKKDNPNWNKARATILKDLVALANSLSGRQGYLVYGVQDHQSSREVVGFSRTVNQLYKLDDADFQMWAKNAFDPPPLFRFCQLETTDGKSIGVFVVDPVPGFPHVVRLNFGDVLYEGQVWFRQGSRNCVALHDDLEVMFKGSEPLHIPKGSDMQYEYAKHYSEQGYEITYRPPKQKNYLKMQGWQPACVPGTRQEIWIIMTGFDVVMLVRPKQ